MMEELPGWLIAAGGVGSSTQTRRTNPIRPIHTTATIAASFRVHLTTAAPLSGIGLLKRPTTPSPLVEREMHDEVID
jgi:hypothetical protein